METKTSDQVGDKAGSSSGSNNSSGLGTQDVPSGNVTKFRRFNYGRGGSSSQVTLEPPKDSGFSPKSDSSLINHSKELEPALSDALLSDKKSNSVDNSAKRDASKIKDADTKKIDGNQKAISATRYAGRLNADNEDHNKETSSPNANANSPPLSQTKEKTKEDEDTEKMLLHRKLKLLFRRDLIKIRPV